MEAAVPISRLSRLSVTFWQCGHCDHIQVSAYDAARGLWVEAEWGDAEEFTPVRKKRRRFSKVFGCLI